MFEVVTLIDMGDQYVSRVVARFDTEERCYQYLAESNLDGYVRERKFS